MVSRTRTDQWRGGCDGRGREGRQLCNPEYVRNPNWANRRLRQTARPQCPPPSGSRSARAGHSTRVACDARRASSCGRRRGASRPGGLAETATKQASADRRQLRSRSRVRLSSSVELRIWQGTDIVRTAGHLLSASELSFDSGAAVYRVCRCRNESGTAVGSTAVLYPSAI
jgi:hypothetical protein